MINVKIILIGEITIMVVILLIILDTTSNNPYNDFLLTVMSGLSQLERDLISQRTKEGLVSAKARGRNGGRPSKQNEKNGNGIIWQRYEDS